MASTSSSAASGIFEAADCGDIVALKKKMEEIGDDRKFRSMCEFKFKALHSAVGMGEIETCKFLVEEVGVDIDGIAHWGDSPLLTAMKLGHLDIAKYLIEQGADVTMSDSKGHTALHCSILHNRPADMEIMALLLTNGADINADSVFGTPLHCAVLSGRTDIVKFLLQNKAEPNSVNKYIGGIPPLVSAMYSKKTNTLECVELLLNAKADPNMVSNGLSPLAHAVETKANNCINSLLAAGADVDSISSCDLRPIEHAALVNNLDAIWILIRARPRILSNPNWSFRKLMERMNYVQADKMIQRCVHSQILREKGDDAWDKQDYSSAITSYDGAIRYNSIGKLFANRSLCWELKGEGLCALQDAETCVRLKPDWAKAHLRKANACHLLERYDMSCDAFMKAYKLDPENDNIDR